MPVLIDQAALIRELQVQVGVFVLAIDGRAGSGKSTLASNLGAAFPHAQLLHTDDASGWENPFRWREMLRTQVLEPVRRSEVGHFATNDFMTGEATGQIAVRPEGLVIIEGVGLLDPTLFDLYNGTVWVETDTEVCLERGLTRDGQEALPLWMRFREEENAYIELARPSSVATWVVSGE